MGRGKIEIKRIDNDTNRQVTFSKRKGGLLKKARELAVLTDAQVGLIIFSANGKQHDYCSHGQGRMGEIIHRYLQNPRNTHHEGLDNHQQLCNEIMSLKEENHMLMTKLRQFFGEDPMSLMIRDLRQLEEQVDYSFKKEQLWNQPFMDCYPNQQLVMEQQEAVEQQNMREMGIFDRHCAHGLMAEEDRRNVLQLWPQMNQFQLQPTQPNLQDSGLHSNGLRL